MKLSLQLKLGQQLTMTPQLQQAIKLLQLSTFDLQQEIQNVLESNPLLEIEEDAEALAPTSAAADTEIVDYTEAVLNDSSSEDSYTSMDLDTDNQFSQQLAVDTLQEDVYLSTSSYHQEEDWHSEHNADPQQESLQSHLLWQLNLLNLSEIDRAIAFALIDAIDPAGYLTAALEEIHTSLGENIAVELEDIQVILSHIQQLDPAGVGARNLQECLTLQLKQLPVNTAQLSNAQRLINQHLALLEQRDYQQLMRRLQLSETELQSVLHLIQSLNPKPGYQISANKPDYLVPDVLVRKVDGCWRVELNTELLPKLRINNYYAQLLKQQDSGRAQSLRQQLQEARWFIKSLQNRSDTLLKVASCIVEHQKDFLEKGDEAMRPLILQDVATSLQIHESTVSRVTTQKYLYTPHGIYELKYFFSSHVNTAAGGECSATAIRAMIKKWVGEEDAKKPLSDQQLVEFFTKAGIQVARRTIAKYRESVGIASSNERKQRF